MKTNGENITTVIVQITDMPDMPPPLFATLIYTKLTKNLIFSDMCVALKIYRHKYEGALPLICSELNIESSDVLEA